MAATQRKATRLVKLPERLLRADLERRLPLRLRNQFRDLTGLQLKRCTVVGLAGFIGNHSAWLCKCNCGTLFVSRSNAILHRPITCGCGDNGIQHHGGSTTEEYAPWRHMLKTFPGMVCKRWFDFQTFRQDVGARPQPDYVLGRVDTRKPFTLNNTVWQPKLGEWYGRKSHPITQAGKTLTSF